MRLCPGGHEGKGQSLFTKPRRGVRKCLPLAVQEGLSKEARKEEKDFLWSQGLGRSRLCLERSGERT